MLVLQNPFFGPGLTIVQRLCYFGAMAHYLFPFFRLTFYTIPVAYLCFNVWSSSVGFGQYALMALPYLTLYWLANNYTFRNYRHSFWSDIYAAIVSPVLAYYSICTFINPFGPKFEVTPKGDQRGHLSFDIRLLWPNLVILSIFLLASLCGIVKAWLAPSQIMAVTINIFWNLYNTAVVLSAILVGMERPEQRTGYRVIKSMPITIARLSEPSTRTPGYTLDLNEYGAQVRLAPDIPQNYERGDKLIFSLEDRAGELLEVDTIIRRKRFDKAQQILGLQFYDNNLATRRRLIEIAYCSAENWSTRSEPNDSLWLSFKMVVMSPFRVLANTSKREWVSAYDSSDIPAFLSKLRVAIGQSHGDESKFSAPHKQIVKGIKPLTRDGDSKH
jgi:cellulose synthase (UDP-forming)